MPRSSLVKSESYLILETFAVFGLHGGIGKKIYINEASHMTKMAPIPIYGKKIKIVFSKTD